MRKTIVMVAGLLGLLLLGISDVGAAAPAKAMRAVDMTSEDWSELQKAKQEVIVEFRQGDEIPVSFSSEGDLLESTVTGVGYVKVKRSFWMRICQSGIEMSLDGSQFKPLSDVVSGSFTAGAGAQTPGVPVNAINMMLKATLKSPAPVS
jgi:hypothetical protein